MECYDIQETPEPEQETKINIDKDKTFNKLKQLQELIKKESALKELCKLFNKKIIDHSHSKQRRYNK